VRLQGEDLRSEELAAWEQWLSDPDNERAFNRMDRLWTAAPDLEMHGLPSAAEQADDRYDGSQPVRDWLAGNAATEAERRTRARARWPGLALAAMLALVAVGIVVFNPWQAATSEPSRTYLTATGEHRDLALSDGSTIVLGARSSVQVDYSDRLRSVVLLRGQAFFEVAKDPARPFTVAAGSGTITAVGTAFNVERSAERVIVTVTEGKVEVAQTLPQAEAASGASQQPAPRVARLARSERIVYDADGHWSDVERTDSEAAIAWRDGRLRYRAEPLRHVLTGINRYSTREIVIVDPALGDLTFTGTVFEDRIDEWLYGLEDIFPIEVAEASISRIELRARR
jgi:transmembrane sensor